MTHPAPEASESLAAGQSKLFEVAIQLRKELFQGAHAVNGAWVLAEARAPFDYVLLGGGGHATEIIQVMRDDGRCRVAAIFDDDATKHGGHLEEVPWVSLSLHSECGRLA